jgi:RHS repeat-associated protein
MRSSSWSFLGIVGRALAWSRYARSPRGAVARGVYGRVVSLLVSLVVVLAVVGVCAGPAFAKTAVSSEITANTTWTLAGSPYDLDSSNINVKAGVTLTIEPGVTVDFNAGEYANLNVKGTIKSLGTASSPVVFTSSQALLGGGAPGQYKGIDLESGNASSQFSYTDFYYGAIGSSYRFYYAVLKVEKSSSVEVDHSTFEHNSYSGINVSEGSAATVSYSTFANNGGGVSAIGENVVTINNSTMSKNVEDGLFWKAPEKATKATGMSVMYNTITGNESNGIVVQQSCNSALSLFPHGEYNNIYANGGAKEAGKQLQSLSVCNSPLPVDWENNYWGSEVNYHTNEGKCLSTPTPYEGHLAYSWSKPAHSYEVPEGPLSSTSKTYSETVEEKLIYFSCGWDVFSVVSFLQSPVEGAPEPTGPVLYGENSAADPNLTKVSCGDPVNCITGNFYENYTDLRVPGLNGGLTFTRTYNSQAAVNGTHGPLGYGWSFEYGESLKLDPSGQSATVTNADGSTVTFTNLEGAWRAPAWVQATLVHNEDGTFTYKLPDQRAFTFNSSGVLQKIVDRNGNTTTLTYSEGRLTTVTDPSGRKLSFAYNAAGTVSSITDPAGHVEKFEYDSSGNLTSATDPRNDVTKYGYNTLHEMTSITDPRTGKVTNEYDSSQRVISQTDAMNRKTTWSYASGETKVTLPTGSVMRVLFSHNLPTSITHAYGTSIASTTSYGYDENDNLTSLTDPDGHKMTFTYDSAGNRTSQTDPESHKTSWTYNSTHDVISSTTPGGETTTITRDEHGNATLISRPAPGSTTQETHFEYDSHGNPTSMTDPLARKWTYGYDSQGDRTSETDPEGDKTTWAYNEDSWETSMVSPRGNVTGGEPSKYTTTTERDAQGRPLTVTGPLGHKTVYTYDPDGNLATQTDPNNHKTTYTYDADNEPVKVEEPNGTLVETGYDGAGATTSQTDGNKHTTKYVRNALEQVTEVIDPLGRKTTKEYDLVGNLKSLTDPATRTVTYTYNTDERVTKISYSDGKTPTVEYAYNADGLRTSMVDGTGTTTYTYDQLDRLTKTQDGHGDTVGYEYNLADERTKITYPNGKAVERSFDKAGRIASVKDWLEHTTKFSYDPNSNLTATVFPSGTSEEDTYAYNEADQQTDAKMSKGTETLASLAYTRDNDGQVTKTVAKGLPGAETTEYGYDPNNRLTSAGTASYEYDAADNPTKIPAGTNTYDAANELATGTNVTYSHDELGERTKRTPSTGPATTYGYDQAQNLTSVSRPVEGETPKIEDSYTYNGDGLRASQTISGTTTYLSWELAQGVPSVLDDGTYSYIYGPGGLPVEQIDHSGNVLYLHHDQQGSTRLLTGSTGTVEGAYTFDAYGNQTGHTGTATTPLGYDAQYTSSDTGLIYLRARAYDPATAQFMSTDPIAGLTREPYGYSGENPLNLSDATGLSWLGDLAKGGKEVLEAGGNALAGAANTLTFGASNDVLNAIGVHPNTCSTAYEAGGIAALVGVLFIPGGGEAELAAEEGGLAGEAETVVYRVHGGEAGPWGRSWTPTDPTALDNPRDALGLPNGNSGEYLTTARVNDWTGTFGQRAMPLNGNAGGAPEYVFPNPEQQLEHVSTRSLNQPF